MEVIQLYSVAIKYKKKHTSLFLKILLSFVAVGVGIFSFACTEDDGYLYVMQLTRAVKGFGDAIYLEAEQILNDEVEPEAETGGSTPATDGRGLNLLLIDNIQTECYVKDFLTVVRKSSEGGYYEALAHTSVASLIGAIGMEHGFYSKSGGVIPTSYFPWDDTANAPYYNKAYNGVPASSMTNENLTQSDVMAMGTASQIDQNGNNGVYGFSAGNKIATANIYPEGKTRPGSGGDHYYYPDACAQRDTSLNNALNTLALSDEEKVKINTDEQIALGAFSGLVNNRGPNGALTMISGLAYLESLYNSPQTKVDIAQLSYEEKADLIAKPYNDCTSSLSTNFKGADLTKLGHAGGDMAFAASILLLTSGNNWYCSQHFIDVFTGSGGAADLSYQGIAGWNVLFPGDPVSNKQELAEKLKPYCKDSVSDAIKEVTGTTVSITDLDNVYGIQNDSYENSANHVEAAGWWLRSGYIYCVQDKRSTIYKNKYADGSDPYLLSSYEVSGLGYYFATSTYGEILYANLLYYAGVDVDPTNPDTYRSGFSGEWVAGSPWLGDYNIVTSDLNTKRMQVLNAGYALLGINYSQTGRDCFDLTKRPTLIDCSGFVWRAFADAGLSQELPRTTAGYTTSTVLERIAWSEIKPGDILARRSGNSGHTMIYLGITADGSKVIIMGAHRYGVTSSITETWSLSNMNTTEDVGSTSGTLFNAYRLVGIDN